MRWKLAGGVAMLAVAIVLAVVRVGGLQGGRLDATLPQRPAPAFAGIDAWLNSDPLTLEQLAGDVVLIDFWTYSCINCIRTFPFLRALDEHYGDAGLRIIGVHSPEFAFEREVENVRAAIDRYGLPYAVALDNHMETWRAYRNNFWPHVYLIDAEGVIRFDHIGEGGEDRIETAVRDLLLESGAQLPPPLRFTEDGPSANITPEVYAGAARGGAQGSIGNPEGFRPGEVFAYPGADPQTIARAGTGGVFFLEGAWRAEREFIEAAEDGATLTLPFRARDVFIVASAASGRPRARVLLDGRPIVADVAGESIAAGVVEVSRSDLFVLVRQDEPKARTLTLVAERGFRLFTFTFG